MRTPKIETLHRLIDYSNKKWDSKFIKHEIDKSEILNNSWLSGFLEADGNFYFNYKFINDLKDANPCIINVFIT
jgi:hypothetical protein